MCGRYLLRAKKKDIGKAFEIDVENLPVIRYGRYNIAPSQDVPAIIFSDSLGTRELRMFRWGLIPSWAKDASIGNRMINARAETIQEKPSFKKAFQSRRCLVLADGFYEWKTVGKKKQPYLFTQKDDTVFAFAGIYEKWKSPEGDLIESCCIITTEANALVKDVHDRMPVILSSPDQWNSWLDPKNRQAESLLRSLSPELMSAYPVSMAVNNPRNDSEDLIQKVASTEIA